MDLLLKFCMMKQLFCLVFCFLFGTIFGQNFVKHQVVKGETITQIALKYKITPHDIFELNPDSQNGIQPDQILVIPSKSTKINPAVTTQLDIVHTVKAKETLYSILKQYAITEQELYQNNSFF